MSVEIIKNQNSVRYRAVVRIGRKKVSKVFHRKTDAKNWEREMCVFGKNLCFAQPNFKQTCTTTLDELFSRFNTEHSLIYNAFSTRRQNLSLYQKFVAQTFGSALITEITKLKIETYFAYLRRDVGVSNERVNRVRQLLHALFNHAIQWDLVTTNPISRIRKFPAKNSFAGDEIRFLSKSEQERLLDWLKLNDPWLYPKIVVLLHTGIRYGEMAALRVEDVRVNAANPHLRISRTRCRHSGAFQLPKGKKARMIPLSPGILEFLKVLVKDRQGDEPLLWKDWVEGRWSTKCSDHYLKAIKLSKVSKIRIHDLRHTYAVRFLENGGHIFILKEILGHQDVKLTMRYSHFSPAMAEQARGIVDFECPTTNPRFTVVDGGLR